MYAVLYLTFILFIYSNFICVVESCAATAPSTSPIVTSTEIPVELNRCAETSLTSVPAGITQMQRFIEITRSGYTSTRIGTTLDTISTMTLSCTTNVPGFAASIETDNNGVLENDVTPPPQTVTIRVTCSSVDMTWYYETVFMGAPFRRPITSNVSCQEGIPPTAIPGGR